MTHDAERRSLTPAESMFRIPTTARRLVVTPDMASDWLSYRNHPTNRPLSRVVTARYQEDMVHGRWREGTPQGLTFDTDGYLIDGQHRLKAQANAGIDLEYWIFPNEPHATFEVFDSGFKRKASHVLGIPAAHNTATVLRYLAALSDQDRMALTRFSRITTSEILETLKAWPESTWYMDKIQSVWRVSSVPIGAHGAVLAQAARTKHRDKIPAWLEALHTGAIAERTDPRLVLRNRYVTHQYSAINRAKRDVDYAFVTKAWNAYVNGDPINVLRFSVMESLPLVDGFDWNNPHPES